MFDDEFFDCDYEANEWDEEDSWDEEDNEPSIYDKPEYEGFFDYSGMPPYRYNWQLDSWLYSHRCLQYVMEGVNADGSEDYVVRLPLTREECSEKGVAFPYEVEIEVPFDSEFDTFIRQQLDDDISQFGVADELLDEGIWEWPLVWLIRKKIPLEAVCEAYQRLDKLLNAMREDNRSEEDIKRATEYGDEKYLYEQLERYALYTSKHFV